MKSESTFDAVMVRLKRAAGAGSDGQLAEQLGLSGSAYANLKKRGSIPYEKAIAVAMSYKVNLHWLLTGDGEPWHDHVGCPPGLMEPQSERIVSLLAGLSERQCRQVESTLQDYQALNGLIRQVEALQQQVAALQPD